MPRKSRHEEDEEQVEEETAVEVVEEDDDADDDEDTIGLDEAEKEEKGKPEPTDDEDPTESVEDLEKKRLFMIEAEEAMENLTLDDIREILKDNEMDPKLATRLKKLLSEVVEEGDVATMEEAWAEALDRIDEEI